MENEFRIPPKMRSKKGIFFRFFEVWRQRCSQGAPKGSPRHLLGSNLGEKGAKMETKCHEKVVFFEAKCYRILFLRLARLGGKTYGGCLPDVSQMPPRCLPDSSQMPPRCLSDVSQMPPRCLPDVSQMPPRCIPDASQMPPRSLPDASQMSP